MIEVRFNGSRFYDFDETTITRSMDNLSGSFSVVTDKKIDVKSEDQCKVIIDTEEKMNGYVDEVTERNSESGYQLSAYGRDKTCDLIDSCVPNDLKKMKPGAKLDVMLQRMIDYLGFPTKVKADVSIKAFAKDELVVAETGTKMFELIQQYARKRGVYFRTDGNEIVIYRIANIETPVFELTTGKNIIESEVTYSHAERYNTYICRSQAQIGGAFSTATVSRMGETKDTDVRDTRCVEFTGEESMTSGECKSRAEEEANIRRLRGFRYRVKTGGHQQNDKTYDIGNFARVKDKKLQIYGTYLVKEVRYRTTSQGGDTTEMILTYPDAYTLKASIAKNKEKRMSANA